jgi:hypothetical protein
MIVTIEHGSQAWWDLVHGVNRAAAHGKSISISLDKSGRGEELAAVKVGEATWSAHRPVAR